MAEPHVIPRPWRIKDISGQRFGKLTARACEGRLNRTTMWSCICDCGNGVSVSLNNLNDHSSCGCGRPTRTQDISNQTFSRLTVISFHGIRNGGAYWICKCDCGEITTTSANRLKLGKTKSCGCLLADKTRERLTTHGMSGTPGHRSWKSAKSRCFNPASQGFKHYGGRGITMCSEWAASFECFIADMGLRPAGTSLERKDVNGPYSKDNCKWATPTEQARNQRTNIAITYQGETLHLWEWSKRCGVSAKTLWGRHKAGVPLLGKTHARRWGKRPAVG